LFLPLRQALTGRDSGPEMATLVRLIGKEQSVARLRAAA
jgi:glutamyl-tRNA synthetase